MKPLPAQQSTDGKTPGEGVPSLPAAFDSPSEPGSSAHPPSSNYPLQRAYPWLLSLSTAIAALFCLMYITKPVILSSSPPITVPSKKPIPSAPSAPSDLTPAIADGSPAQAGLMPDSDRLPGETGPPPSGVNPTASVSNRTLSAPSTLPGFEETNLRIQHILTAEAPGGHRSRIDLDVPVLYQSRNLRWTPEDVQEARNLLVRLMDYQEKSQQLRAEGSELLASWNRVIGHSLPATELRADSPSLPANQEDAADTPRPAGLISTESIQIQPAEK